MCDWLILAVAFASLTLILQLIFLGLSAWERYEDGKERSVPWTEYPLQTGDSAYRLHDLHWREANNCVEVEYSIENHLPGQTWYRNDFICVFQHGISLKGISDM